MHARELISGLVELLANSLRKRKELRIGVLLLSASTIIADAVILIIKDLDENLIAVSIVVGLISLLFLVSSILGFSEEAVSIKNPFEIELKHLSKEREELKKKFNHVESGAEDNVFNTVQINLNQTTEYYTINKSQARSSFTASLTAIIAGLITILAGVWFIYMGDNITSSVISVSVGALLEVIGGMYFHLYNKSIKQLNYFYGKLEKMQDTMLAIELTEQITNDEKKIEMQEKAILALLERSKNIK
ncbi:TRADD-N-associated membrane domain-containing protein [Halobacillus salinus]|uniref:Cyanobacterial TRADD-N associated 2 transmembrane domain-containing protein n=1 Tax=Halobacillus salinus TaxID=192814 RepID=A0A4Z0H8E0_9BACI|nr:hypothetical protein [Halobacillus salinus]TGB05186.1 hypothetical protein E4663_09410 [Halobacillus salinus]